MKLDPYRMFLVAATLVIPIVSLSRNATAQVGPARNSGLSFYDFVSEQLKISDFSTPDDSAIGPLDNPIFLGSMKQIGPVEEDPLLGLFAIPVIENGVVSIADTPQLSIELGDYFANFDDFQLGDLVIHDPAQKTRLEKSITDLFHDSRRSKPTEEYQRYKDWREKRQALVEAIEAAPEVRSLRSRLKRHDDDYAIDWPGEKIKIEAALERVSQFTSDKPNFVPQREELLELVDSQIELRSIREFYSAVVSRSSWHQYTQKSTGDMRTEPELPVTEFTSPAGAKASLTPTAIALEYAVIPVTQSLMRAQVMDNNAWQRRDGRRISDGAFAHDASEVVPYFISYAVLIRSVDVTFDQSSNAYKSLLRRAGQIQTARLGGFAFSVSDSTAYWLSGHLYLPRPVVIAVVYKSPRPIPSPDKRVVFK